MAKRTDIKNKNPVMRYTNIPEVTFEEKCDAFRALVGAKLDYEDPPLCGLDEIIGALALKETPEGEEQRPQEEPKKPKSRRYYTRRESDMVMAKSMPDAELSEILGRSVASIIQHREHVKNRPVDVIPKYAPE